MNHDLPTFATRPATPVVTLQHRIPIASKEAPGTILARVAEPAQT
jgi:hypothetical protein